MEISEIFDLIVKAIFFICAGFLYAIGLVTEWGYEKASVYINLYLQPILLILIGLYYLCKILFRLKNNKYWCSIIVLLVLILDIYLFYLIYNRYPISDIKFSFNKCVIDLQNLSKNTGYSYELWNLIIFVALYLINIFVYKLSYHFAKRKNIK